MESMVFADKAETSLRAYFLTHQHGASVSELAEYRSMKDETRNMTEARDRAYTEMVNHQKLHGVPAGKGAGDKAWSASKNQ